MERASERQIIEIVAEETKHSWKIICPFCGQVHLHGKGEGHRVAHCDGRKARSAVRGGVTYRPQDGYILVKKTEA